jgi:hypothetical protein
VKDARSLCVVGLILPSIIGLLSEAGPRDERFAPSQDLLLFASPSRPHHKDGNEDAASLQGGFPDTQAGFQTPMIGDDYISLEYPDTPRPGSPSR